MSHGTERPMRFAMAALLLALCALDVHGIVTGMDRRQSRAESAHGAIAQMRAIPIAIAVTLVKGLLAIGLLGRYWRRAAEGVFLFAWASLLFVGWLVLNRIPTGACG